MKSLRWTWGYENIVAEKIWLRRTICLHETVFMTRVCHTACAMLTLSSADANFGDFTISERRHDETPPPPKGSHTMLF